MTSCLFELTLYLSAAIEKDFFLKLKIENVVTFLDCLTFMKNYFFSFYFSQSNSSEVFGVFHEFLL